MSGAEGWVIGAALTGLALAIVLCLYRFARGPSSADRIVMLDQVSLLLASIVGVLAIRDEEPAYLDVAVVVVLTGFAATVALARYLERRVAS